jgi:hypothetical protein
MPDIQQVRQVKEQQKETILRKPNVVGLGYGYKEQKGLRTDQLALVALVREKLPRAALEPSEMVPAQVDGVPTDVLEVGELKAQQSRTGRWRPAPGGVSIGHYKVTAGTLGTVVRDRATGARVILSNNHVLANSNEAEPGDPILQPGAADGGREASDTLARLERFVPIEFTVQPPSCPVAIGVAGLANLVARLLGSRHRLKAVQENPQAVNRVDAATARPMADADLADEILDIGRVQGTLAPALGMAVRKSGRTTGFTTGVINVLDATVSVGYGVGQTAQFEGQIVCGPMSQGGDSGSLLVAMDSLQAVGLLFAGSNQATIFNPIEDVLDLLQIEL